MGKTAKKKTAKKKAGRNREVPRKKAARKKAGKTKAVAKKTAGAKTVNALPKQVPKNPRTANTAAFSADEPGASRSGRQAGDLQGLSRVEGADSESVGELLEEGNAFEADVVAGVEAAGRADEREVRTHELPEDDVPEEYLDHETE